MAIDTIGTNAIANNAVTAAKIPAGAVDADITTLPDGSVTTAKLAADAVTAAKIATNAVRDEMPTGAVLQTVYAKRGHNSGNGHLDFATGSASTFADATDMNLQITPSSTSSLSLIHI